MYGKYSYKESVSIEKADLNKKNYIKSRDKTKSDAIVNGIVMDFKEITGTSKNTLGNNYQDAMRKKHSQGTLLFLVRNMTLKIMESY